MDIVVALDGIDQDGLWRAHLGGVPLWMWPVATLASQRGERPAIVSADPEVRRCAIAAGWLIQNAPAVDPTVVDVGTPFALHESVAHPTEMAALGALGTLRVDSEPVLEIARALVRGLAPDHPLIRAVSSLRLIDAGDIDAVVSDVDGCLTDGGLARTSSGDIIRTYHTRDGIGHHLLREAGVRIAWLSTALEDRSIGDRAEMLGVETIDVGRGDKGPRLRDVCARLGVDPARTVFLGDDTPDLPAMEVAGHSACPSDAHPAVRARASCVLRAPGGRGAFRELADLVVQAVGAAKSVG